MNIDVFVSDLTAYTRGNLIGEWIKLPLPDAELLQDRINSILLPSSEEWFVTEYRAPFKINEYEDLFALNEALLALQEAGIAHDLFEAACMLCCPIAAA